MKIKNQQTGETGEMFFRAMIKNPITPFWFPSNEFYATKEEAENALGKHWVRWPAVTDFDGTWFVPDSIPMEEK